MGKKNPNVETSLQYSFLHLGVLWGEKKKIVAHLCPALVLVHEILAALRVCSKAN